MCPGIFVYLCGEVLLGCVDEQDCVSRYMCVFVWRGVVRLCGGTGLSVLKVSVDGSVG